MGTYFNGLTNFSFTKVIGQLMHKECDKWNEISHTSHDKAKSHEEFRISRKRVL